MVYQQGTRAVTFQPISPLSTRFTISMDIHRRNSLRKIIPILSSRTVSVWDPRLEEKISDQPATPSTTMSHTPTVDTRTPLPLDTRMPTAHFLPVAFGSLLSTSKYSMKSYLKDFVTTIAFRICISRQLRKLMHSSSFALMHSFFYNCDTLLDQFVSCQVINRDLQQTTIATATRTWQNKRSNEQNSSSGRAF